ncbi:MAG: prephenate dehydratase [Anaerolineae bacterium]|nr:prephenate dehydratase [Anaerolineae bacterium]
MAIEPDVSWLASVQRVAFQGERGAYSEAAALALLGDEGRKPMELLPQRTFDAVFAAVESGQADVGVVPMENSLAGSIHRNYDLLLEHPLYIVAEHNLRVSHCLIGHPGVTLDDIRRVYSHPQALAQCERSLEQLPLDEVIAAHDTAGSVKLIKDEGWRDAAAIAGEHAAKLYGMQILLREFEDEKANYTRFIAIAREPIQPERQPGWRGEAKTSLAFAGKNEPGLLFRCMSAFALRNIDLTKIESRPLRGVPWEYIFYLDFAGSVSEERCQRALDHLREMASFVRVFGSYVRARTASVESEE